jgi:hypothetical protein
VSFKGDIADGFPLWNEVSVILFFTVMVEDATALNRNSSPERTYEG